MKKIGKKVTIVILLLFIIMQFLPIGERKTEEVILDQDFIAMTSPGEEISSILINSCYDCHSEATKGTWYSDIAPVSWWINNHINHGKKHLSFSKWAKYPKDKQEHKIEECIEMIEEDHMPLSSYTLMHSDAVLDADKKEKLISFFKSI